VSSIISTSSCPLGHVSIMFHVVVVAGVIFSLVENTIVVQVEISLNCSVGSICSKLGGQMSRRPKSRLNSSGGTNTSLPLHVVARS
jgi:hypothetical protein